MSFFVLATVVDSTFFVFCCFGSRKTCWSSILLYCFNFNPTSVDKSILLYFTCFPLIESEISCEIQRYIPVYPSSFLEHVDFMPSFHRFFPFFPTFTGLGQRHPKLELLANGQSASDEQLLEPRAVAAEKAMEKEKEKAIRLHI